jgi:predicted dienelactone hydrolase
LAVLGTTAVTMMSVAGVGVSVGVVPVVASTRARPSSTVTTRRAPTATASPPRSTPPRSTSVRSAGATPPPVPAQLLAVPPTDPTVFASPGPFLAGVTTIDVPSPVPGQATKAEVWYPVNRGGRIPAAKSQTAYDLKDWLPAPQQKLLGTRPGTAFKTTAVRDATVAPGVLYPIVVLSHGFGGYRLESPFLTTHLASWGFVVVAPDHHSRDLDAALSPNSKTVPATDIHDIYASLSALSKSPLGSHLDYANLAGVGFGEGADTVIRWAAAEPAVQGVVALGGGVSASGSTPLPDPLRPILYVSAVNDKTVRAQSIATAYRASQSPKRLIQLRDSGHFAFSDVCPVTNGRGLFGEAERLGAQVPLLLKNLGTDGCQAPNVTVLKAWPTIQSSVVAEFRSAMGSGTPGFALDQNTLDTLSTRGAVKATFTIG